MTPEAATTARASKKSVSSPSMPTTAVTSLGCSRWNASQLASAARQCVQPLHQKTRNVCSCAPKRSAALTVPRPSRRGRSKAGAIVAWAGRTGSARSRSALTSPGCRNPRSRPRAHATDREARCIASMAIDSAQGTGFIVSGSRAGSRCGSPPASSPSVTGCLPSGSAISVAFPTIKTVICAGSRSRRATR